METSTADSTILVAGLHNESNQNFRELTAQRLGLTQADVLRIVEMGLDPILRLSAGGAEVVPSPLVATVIDLALEHGSEELRDQVGKLTECNASDPEAYVRAYETTRVSIGNLVDLSLLGDIWPDADSFVVGEAPHYKSSDGTC